MNITKGESSNTFGTWDSSTFRKAQFIFKWQKKTIFQIIKLITLKSSLFLVLYLELNEEIFYLILYLLSVILYLIIATIRQLSLRSERVLENVEASNFIVSSLATAAVVIGSELIEDAHSALDRCPIFVIWLIQSKFFAIFSYKLYAIPILINLLLYAIL